MLAELSQGRSCGQTARGGRGTVCRVEFSYPEAAAVKTSPLCHSPHPTPPTAMATVTVQL